MVGALSPQVCRAKGFDCLGFLTRASRWPFLSRVAHLAVPNWLALRYDSHREMRMRVGFRRS